MNLKSVRVGTSMVAVIISLTIWISLLFPLGTVFAQGNQEYSFVTKWGSEGIGNGKFTQSIVPWSDRFNCRPIRCNLSGRWG
ncbi:MAG: hypothetical protein QOK57_09145 [Nitrososphaeraceae archaeon]|nr:hypothetical protein [Nitrososphaeraceae archaeon]